MFGTLQEKSSVALESIDEYRTVLWDRFGIALSDEDLQTALTNVERRGTRGPPHPFFA
jgi:N-hydroxyarylamine O-acetyltransferase